MPKHSEPSDLPEEAQRYKEYITCESAKVPTDSCAKCGSNKYKQYERCKRWFYVVVDSIIYPIHCNIVRWQCMYCKTSFRKYPDVCLRHKRYLRPEYLKRVESYSKSVSTSFRRAVLDCGAAVVHTDEVATSCSSEKDKEAEAVRELAPSTVYRWIREFTPLFSITRKYLNSGNHRSILIFPRVCNKLMPLAG